MPRTYPPRRECIGLRLAPAGLAEIDALAEHEGVNRSEMIRRLLAEALTSRATRPSLTIARMIDGRYLRVHWATSSTKPPPA